MARERSAWVEDAKRLGPNFSTITGGGQAVIEFLLATTSQFAIKPTLVTLPRATGSTRVRQFV